MIDVHESPFLYPMAAHGAWIVLLYASLTLVRAPDAWGIGRTSDGANPYSAIEPKLTANLRNQFEWPIFFYLVCILLIIEQSNHPLQTGFAWLFVAGRILHTCIHVFLTGVRWRGLVFSVNFVAVLAMWCIFLSQHIILP